MIEDFFNEIKVPKFLSGYFEKEDWYLLIADLKQLVKDNIANEQNSTGDNIHLTGDVYIGNNSTIGPNVVIEGPVYIGDNVEVGPAAYIRPGSVISNNCVVAHASEIKNALMMEGSKVSNHCFLGDSILGAKARLGGHSETANRRFDQKEIIFIYKDKKLETGLDKLGSIVGEGARLGGGVLLSPGSMVGQNTFIASGLSLGGYFEPSKFVKTKTQIEMVDNNFSGELHSKAKIFE